MNTDDERISHTQAGNGSYTCMQRVGDDRTKLKDATPFGPAAPARASGQVLRPGRSVVPGRNGLQRAVPASGRSGVPWWWWCRTMAATPLLQLTTADCS